MDDVLQFLREKGGTFSSSFESSIESQPWTVAIVWGKEAEDSNMAAAAAYGTGDTFEDALASAKAEAGIGG